MKKWALITGASGGIGRELAFLFAADGIPVILVSRDQHKLDEVAYEIKATHDVQILTYAVDLSKAESAQELHKFTKKQKATVGYLVNNAGFGDKAAIIDADPERLQNMISLNDQALVALSHYYAKDMVAAKAGNIVNIASIAALVPGPGMAVYYASKAFVLSFSQALAQEVAASGVVVTTVCPGASDTGFAKAAHAEKSGIFSGKLPSAADVAQFSYEAMKRGDLLAIWGTRNKLLARVVTLAPRRWMLRKIAALQG